MPAMDEKSSILEMVENCIRYTYPNTGVQAGFPVQSDELAAAFADETLPGLRESTEMTAAINQSSPHDVRAAAIAAARGTTDGSIHAEARSQTRAHGTERRVDA